MLASPKKLVHSGATRVEPQSYAACSQSSLSQFASMWLVGALTAPQEYAIPSHHSTHSQSPSMLGLSMNLVRESHNYVEHAA